VTDEQIDAAGKYIAFLRARPQQEVAKRFGFRPSDPGIPIEDMLTAASGVSSAPLNYLAPPRASVINAVRQLWRDKKNPAAPLP
jgi:Ca-activated chloride channel family protein